MKICSLLIQLLAVIAILGSNTTFAHYGDHDNQTWKIETSSSEFVARNSLGKDIHYLVKWTGILILDSHSDDGKCKWKVSANIRREIFESRENPQGAKPNSEPDRYHPLPKLSRTFATAYAPSNLKFPISGEQPGSCKDKKIYSPIRSDEIAGSQAIRNSFERIQEIDQIVVSKILGVGGPSALTQT